MFAHMTAGSTASSFSFLHEDHVKSLCVCARKTAHGQNDAASACIRHITQNRTVITSSQTTRSFLQGPLSFVKRLLHYNDHFDKRVCVRLKDDNDQESMKKHDAELVYP